MKYKILASGSSGNCYRFNRDLVIDFGVAYNKVKEDVKDIKYLLLTHTHSDHFDITAIRKLVVDKEDIKILAIKEVKDKLSKFGINSFLIEPNKIYKLGNYKIAPVKLYHDVENIGYRLLQNNHKHIHITDTQTVKFIEAKNYDSATIEANYHLETALNVIEKAAKNEEFTHLKRSLKTHLEVQEAIDFIKQNNIKKFDFIHIGDSTRKEVLETINKELR